MKGFREVALATVAVLLFAASVEAFQRGGSPARGGRHHHVGRQHAYSHGARPLRGQFRKGRPHAFKPHPGLGRHPGFKHRHDLGRHPGFPRFKDRHGFAHHGAVFGRVRPHKHIVPPVVIFGPAPIYIAPPPYYWYYCRDPAGYYPYVPYCPGGWIPVIPH